MERIVFSDKNKLASAVQRYGFLPFFPCEINGFSIEENTPPEFWFVDGVDGPWEWKSDVISQTNCAYGKFFHGRAGYISKEWFLHFANYRRDGYDFDARCDDGLVRYQDKYVYETLLERGALTSKQLKWLCGYGRGGNKGFDAVITRLQMLGYVITKEFVYQLDKYGKPYGWGIAVYTTPELFFGEWFRQNVYLCTPEQSKERITEHLLSLFPQSTKQQIEKLIR